MQKIWIIVAESSRARFFETSSINHPLKEIQTFDHDAARAHSSDLTADVPGHASDGKAKGGSHALGADFDPKAQEALIFAKSLIVQLEAGRTQGKFDRLIIVAAPAFLGLLRKYMNDALRSKIEREIHKNLLQSEPADIHEVVFG